MLAFLLRTGRQGQNAVDLDREVINKFDGHHRLMSTTSKIFDLFEYLSVLLSDLPCQEFNTSI